MSSSAKKNVCIVTPSLMSVRFFLKPHIEALSREYNVTLVTNIDDLEYLQRINLSIPIVHIPIERKISLSKDLAALLLMIKFFLTKKFDIVHTIAPKAGLIGILAAWLAQVPRRLHVFQGEIWVTRKGLMRFILKNIDRLVSTLSTNLLVVSVSERDFLIKQKVITSKKSSVLANGSICGVDRDRFKFDIQAREKIRKELGLMQSDILLLFLGRLTKDKGILELLDAFNSIDSNIASKVHLLIVGPDEENILSQFHQKTPSERLHYRSYTEVPQDYMSASDIILLPSFREGFGLVIIEAAAIKVPAIGSNIYGISDAIQDGVTGVLFKPHDMNDLKDKILYLAQNDDIRIKMGEAAYVRCKNNFDQKTLVQELVHYYKSMS